MSIKVYLITSPCSGKSYFHRKYSNYNGMTIIDHNDLSSRLILEGKINIYTPDSKKTDIMIMYLRNLDYDACILGGYLPSDPAKYPDIVFKCVVLPKYKHYFFTLKRRTHFFLSKVKSFLMTQKWPSTTDRWNYWSTTSQHRNKIVNFANQYDLKKYPSIVSALDDTTA